MQEDKKDIAKENSDQENSAKDTEKELIQRLKQRYGKIFALEVPISDTETITGYFKVPDRQTLEATTSLAERSPLTSNEVLIKNCYVGGDDRIINDENVLLSAILTPNLRELISIKRGLLKKL